jgi:hypothetical protein
MRGSQTAGRSEFYAADGKPIGLYAYHVVDLAVRDHKQDIVVLAGALWCGAHVVDSAEDGGEERGARQAQLRQGVHVGSHDACKRPYRGYI